MATKVIPLGRFADELREFSHVHIDKQKTAFAAALARSIQILVASSPVDTGLFAQSWHFSVDETSAIIGNYAPHAPIIEFGARPFTPPIAPLLAWAKRVLKDPSQPPKYSDAVWGLAKYTQAKIAREGMKPKHVLTNALPKIVDNIKEELKRVA